MICWISTWLNFLVFILVRIKLFVFFWLDGSSLHQDELKLTLIGLLGIFWSCSLWRYFPWEYEGVYWFFLCISWSSYCYGCWVLWSYTCYAMEEAQKMGLTDVWFECDFILVCVAFTIKINVLWMLRNWWNTCLNYCGKISFMITHIFREGNVCANKLVILRFIHRESFHWYNTLSSRFLEFSMNRYSLLMYHFC